MAEFEIKVQTFNWFDIDFKMSKFEIKVRTFDWFDIDSQMAKFEIKVQTCGLDFAGRKP